MEDWSTKSYDSSRNDEFWLSLQGIQADLSTLQGRQKLIEGVIESFGGSLHILGRRSSCQPVVIPGTSEIFTSKLVAKKHLCLWSAVNNVGCNVRKPTVEYSPKDFSSIMKTNLESAYNLTQVITSGLLLATCWADSAQAPTPVLS